VWTCPGELSSFSVGLLRESGGFERAVRLGRSIAERGYLETRGGNVGLEFRDRLQLRNYR
jgi:hypothetical protein